MPGVGRLLLASIGSRDFPVAQAVVVLLAAWVVVVNFIADVLYQYMDPRIRIQSSDAHHQQRGGKERASSKRALVQP